MVGRAVQDLNCSTLSLTMAWGGMAGAPKSPQTIRLLLLTRNHFFPAPPYLRRRLQERYLP